MTKEITLTRGKTVLVDSSDYKELSKYNWCALKGSHTWYAVRSVWVNNTTSPYHVRMHRDIMQCPSGKVVDHINGNGLDNRRSNLRVCTHKENCRSSRNISKGSSKYKGVSRNGSNWCARITIDNVGVYLGQFKSQEDAAYAYNQAALTHFGEYALLNSIVE